MSSHIFTSPEGTHYLYTEDPLGVTIVDSSMELLSSRFVPAGEDYDCCASLTGRRFALGYWRSADLHIFDLESGHLHGTFPFKRIGPIVSFSTAGNRLLFKSGSKVYVLDIESGHAQPVTDAQSLSRTVFLGSTETVLIPSRRKGQLVQLSLPDASSSPVQLPVSSTFLDLKASPTSPHCLLIARNKSVLCVDYSSWDVLWSVSIKKHIGRDHAGVGQFCGDGSLFGVAVSGDSNYTVVLKADSGEMVNRIEALQYGLPYQGTLVRSSSTSSDNRTVRTLDLATATEGTATLGGNAA